MKKNPNGLPSALRTKSGSYWAGSKRNKPKHGVSTIRSGGVPIPGLLKVYHLCGINLLTQ